MPSILTNYAVLSDRFTCSYLQKELKGFYKENIENENILLVE
jgi:hypothetical protein